MAESPTPRVVFQPAVYRAMQQGINQMVEAVRPTLGPRPRLVAIDRTEQGKLPELLDNGAIIARRIIELSDRDANMGAMLVRHVLWHVHDQAGDGAATAAVLFQAIFDQGVRYVVSGGSAMQVRHYLEEGRQVILERLSDMVVPVKGKKALAHVAETICYDPALAKMLGEIFDIIGEYGYFEVQAGHGRELEREYVEGMYWEGGVLSREMISNQADLKVEMHDASILITDLELTDPRQLLPVLDAAKGAGLHALVVMAKSVSDGVTALLLSASRTPDKFQVIAVKTPSGALEEQAWALEDLAFLTGGRPIVRAAGSTLAAAELADLGRVRRVWADRHHFGFTGGKGDPRRLRAHIADLRAAYQRTTDVDVRQRLQKRIGKLMGGSATLWVGGASEPEVERYKDLATRTAEALRGAVRQGVVPGGGVSLLACVPVLQQKLGQSADADERAAYRILIDAMKAPIRTILSNAGYDASEAMAQIALAGQGCGLDVRSGKIVNMTDAGIWDVAAVLQAVVRSAVSGAAMALTTDVMIHGPKLKASGKP